MPHLKYITFDKSGTECSKNRGCPGHYVAQKPNTIFRNLSNKPEVFGHLTQLRTMHGYNTYYKRFNIDWDRTCACGMEYQADEHGRIRMRCIPGPTSIWDSPKKFNHWALCFKHLKNRQTTGMMTLRMAYHSPNYEVLCIFPFQFVDLPSHPGFQLWRNTQLRRTSRAKTMARQYARVAALRHPQYNWPSRLLTLAPSLKTIQI
jgi:hypothetical protein